jgi:hypothetical protein
VLSSLVVRDAVVVGWAARWSGAETYIGAIVKIP